METTPDRRWSGPEPEPVPAGMQTMTRQQVAELWGVHERVVTRYAQRGVLAKYTTGRDGAGRAGRIVFSAEQARRVGDARGGDSRPAPAPMPETVPPTGRRW